MSFRPVRLPYNSLQALGEVMASTFLCNATFTGCSIYTWRRSEGSKVLRIVLNPAWSFECAVAAFFHQLNSWAVFHSVFSRIQRWLNRCIQAQHVLTQSEIEFASTSLQSSQKTHMKDMKYIKKKKIPTQSSKTIYPFPTHFTQTTERMWNLTWEVWIFWHLFFTLVTAAVIAFEGSLIHLRRTLLSLSRKHDWYLTRPLFISSRVGAVFVAVFVWGAHTAFELGAKAAGRPIDFIDGLLFLVLGVWFFSLTFDLLVCVLQWHRYDSVLCFFFLQRFKRWKSVMMKIPFKQAQVGWE